MKTYFILSPAMNRIKIGRATHPERRLLALQTGSPDRLQLLGAVEGDREAEMHARFSQRHLHGEWFRCDDDMRNELSHLITAVEHAATKPYPPSGVIFGRREWLSHWRGRTELPVELQENNCLRLVRVSDAAEILMVDECKVRQAIAKGELRVRRYGRCTRIPLLELKRLITTMDAD